jgi:hypothetical protein
MRLPNLANAVIPQQTTRDLPLISALSDTVPPAAVPPSVAAYFSSTVAVGSGPNDSIVVCDIIGTAGGFVSAGAMANTISNLANVNVVALTSTYSTMANVVDGQYGDPTTGPVVIDTGPYAGNTYLDAEEAFANLLIPGAQSQIGTVVSSYPSQTANLNINWNNMAAQLTREISLQAQAGINYANLVPNSTSSMYSFIFTLPSTGRDTQAGGICQLVESVAVIGPPENIIGSVATVGANPQVTLNTAFPSAVAGDEVIAKDTDYLWVYDGATWSIVDYLTTFTGQAVIACLREGRNQVALQSVGITTNADIPSEPNPPAPTANLIPSTYSAQQAANLVVV